MHSNSCKHSKVAQEQKVSKFCIYSIIRVPVNNNSSTSSCLRSSSCRTDLSIHFQPSRPTTIWMLFWVTLTLSSSTFCYETDHRKCEITLAIWHCSLRLFKLGRPLYKGFESRSLAWRMLHSPDRCHLHHRGGCLISNDQLWFMWESPIKWRPL